jgi:hypothetical protein
MAGADPYRAPSEPRGSSDAVLHLRARTAETHGLGNRAVLVLVSSALAWAVVMHLLSAVLDFSVLALATLLAVCITIAVAFARVTRPRRVKLESRGAYVTLRVGTEPPRVIVATDVTEITLDHTEEAGFAIVGHGVRSAAVASATGRARVVIKVADGAEVRLPSMPLSHTEIVEWLGDVRRFMRAAGFARSDEISPDSETPIAHLDQAEG